ncbi:MAG: response regulator [Gemmatimonadales bacterium]
MLADHLDVLLVEAEALEAELLQRSLLDLAPAERIGVARDGEEALDYLLARNAFRHRLGAPLPPLVLLAHRLPRLDGIEVLRTLRASPRTSTVPIVMLSSAAEPRELAQCYQAGANSCIVKPIEFRALAETLRELGRYWLRLNRPAPSGVAAG